MGSGTGEIWYRGYLVRGNIWYGDIWYGGTSGSGTRTSGTVGRLVLVRGTSGTVGHHRGHLVVQGTSGTGDIWYGDIWYGDIWYGDIWYRGHLV